MNMKKIIIAIVLLVALCLNVFAMSGCDINFNGNDGGNGGNGGNNGAQNDGVGRGGIQTEESLTYDGSEVEITFYHTMGQNLRDVLDKYIAEFNKLYPNIKITHSQVGSYDDVRDTINTELTVGNQPNIAYCYPDHVALYNMSGKVITLDNLINSKATVKQADGAEVPFGMTQAQIDDFIDAYYDEGKQFGDGKMYTLPLSKSTEVLYYNKTFFEQHNLKVPTTWDEMEEVCKKILEIDPECIPLGYDSEANWFITMCEQMQSGYTSSTGERFVFDNETNRNFVKRFAEWHHKGYVTTEEIYGSYTSGLFTAKDGTCSYMCIGSSAGASYQRPTKDANGNYRFDVAITTIPQYNQENKKVISQGPSICMFDAPDQEIAASWLFVKYLTTCGEFQAEFSMTSGYVPVIESVLDIPVYADYLAGANGGDSITALSTKVCLEQRDYYYVSPAFNGSAEARNQVGYLLQTCMVKFGSASDVDAMIAEEFQKAMDECKYMA